MSKHSKTHAHEKLRRRVRREGALKRRETDAKEYGALPSDANVYDSRGHRAGKVAQKLAVAKREVEALRKKLGL